MKKNQISKSISVAVFDENDYLQNQKEIYDSLIKILNSFDADQTINFQKEYIENLNSDIYIDNKKAQIFLLKQNRTPVCYIIFSNGNIDAICTNYEYTKLGYATILLRVMATELKNRNIAEFCVEVDDSNIVALSLFESFSKIEGVQLFEGNQENNKKLYKFDIKNIKNDEILQKIKDFAI